MSFNLNKLVQPECGAPNPLVAAAQQIAIKSTMPDMTQRFHGPSSSVQQLRMNFAREFAQREPPPLVTSAAGASRLTRPSTAIVQPSTLSHQHQHQHQQQPSLQMINHHMTAPRLTEFNHQALRQPFHDNTQQQRGLSSSISAGDQLETKYRNDMISHSTLGLNHTQLHDPSSAGKLDDVEFWQSLSQAYMGPNTFNAIAKLRAERAARLESAGESTTQVGLDGDKTLELTDEEIAKQREMWQQDELETARLVESMKLNDMDYTFDERNPLKDQFEDPFAEGLRRLEQGDIPSAALLFEASVQRDPENAQAWHYLGTTQAQNEKDKSAIRALLNCLHLDPNDQEARLAIAVSLVNETQHRVACRHLLEWLMKHERYQSIQASLEQFQELDQELSEDLFMTNHSLMDKHYKYVRDKFVEAARMSPNNPDPEVQNSLGVLFNMRGEYDKAVDCFKAALSVRQEDSLLWNRLGATLANGNKSDEAVIAYRRALEIAPGFLRSRYNLAISLIHLNLYDEAARQLIQILNTQAAGKGSKNVAIRTRSITSNSIWNTLRTVATLMNKPELYPIIDGRDLGQCNTMLMTETKTS